MKKSISTAILLAAALLSAQSCRFIQINGTAFDGAGNFVFNSSGKFVEPSDEWQVLAYTVDDFSAIRSTIPMDITYEMNADSSFVEIFAPENYLEYMDFKTVDGCLNAEFSEPLRTRADGMRMKVASSSLEKVEMLGVGDFHADSLVCSSLELVVKGAGDAEFGKVLCTGDFDILIQGAGDARVRELECNDIDARIQGAGDIRLAGKAREADLTIQGAGEIHIENLEVSGEVETSVQGVGKIYREND